MKEVGLVWTLLAKVEAMMNAKRHSNNIVKTTLKARLLKARLLKTQKKQRIIMIMIMLTLARFASMPLRVRFSSSIGLALIL